MDDGEFWFWAAPDGSLKTVDQSELIAGLIAGTMSPKTLVWRQGWGEWLRASEVPELTLAIPVNQRGPVIRPMMSPDATHPPPIPIEKGNAVKVLEPIVPVASSPENDRPGTELMIDIEFSSPKNEPVKSPSASALSAPRVMPPGSSAPKSAPPSRKSAPPVLPHLRAAISKPIVPAASSPMNDKPTTLEDSAVVLEEQAPPRDLWDEVAASQPPLRSAPHQSTPKAATPKALEPIVPAESSPHHDPVTGLIGDDELEVLETAAGAVSQSLPKTAPSTPGTLDSLAASVEAKKPPRPVPVIAVTAPRAAPASGRPSTPPPPPSQRASTSSRPPPPSMRSSAPAVAPVAPAPVPVQPLPFVNATQPQFSPVPVAPAPVPVATPAPAPAAPPIATPAPVAALAAAPIPAPGGKFPHAVTLQFPNPVLTPPPAQQPALAEPDDAPTRHLAPIVPVSEPEHDAPTQIHAGAARAEGQAPLPSWSADVDQSQQQPAQPGPYTAPQAAWAQQQTPMPQTPYAPAYEPYSPPKKSALPMIIGIVGVLGLLGAGAVGGLLYFKPWQSAEPAPAAATTSAAAKAAASAPKLAGCSVAREATRLAPAAVVNVPLYVAQIKGSNKVAVGLAQSEMAALGLEIDAASLQAKEVFTQPGFAKLVGVVPQVGSDKTRFIVDRQGGQLGVPHSIDFEPPFAIGFSAKGYTRLNKNNELEAIWPAVANEKATEARVVSVPSVGHYVAFRTGGQVRGGWLKPNGLKKTDLGAVDGEGSKVGTPNVGANERQVMVAFAARGSDSDPWSVQLATAKHGENPTNAKRFALPSGGPGGDGIAPSVAGLPDGRWLIQWTEGAAGQRVVRAVTLDEKLQPVGDAMSVSAAGKEAGQGVVAVAGERAVAFHLVKGDKGYELWGTGISCGAGSGK